MLDVEKIMAVEISRKIARMPSYSTIQKVEWISEERVLIECGTAESAKIALDLVENFSMKVTNPDEKNPAIWRLNNLKK